VERIPTRRLWCRATNIAEAIEPFIEEDYIWEVEYTDEFEEWWQTLSQEDEESIRACVEVLEEMGPAPTHDPNHR